MGFSQFHSRLSPARSPVTRERPAWGRALQAAPSRASWACRPPRTDFLASHSPGLLPGRVMPATPGDPDRGVLTRPSVTCHTRHDPRRRLTGSGAGRGPPGHRRSMIAKRDVEKVFRSDEFSGMGYGAPAAWGSSSSGCSRSSSSITRRWRAGRFPWRARRTGWPLWSGEPGAAMQGLVVVPLFVGYDEDGDRGRISATTWPAVPTGAAVPLHRFGIPVRPGALRSSTPTACQPMTPGLRAGAVRRG